ncbi:hypothetical protein [Paracoccus sanguinis]|uniref:hypothetical protein n=1 Tax=Paracoccus sanguinis TaxID=1545044 RepID=UPI000691F178|nr:hypothetical protein [Paracoccus sanguinis]
MSVLASIERGLLDFGYSADALHRAYSFADVLDSAAKTRTVALAAFTQTSESFRSAAFGVVEGEPDSAAAVMANRALGAPIFFSIDSRDVGVWAVGAQAPRLLERVSVDQLADLFGRYRDSWTPQALHRAKSLDLRVVRSKLISSIWGCCPRSSRKFSTSSIGPWRKCSIYFCHLTPDKKGRRMLSG